MSNGAVLKPIQTVGVNDLYEHNELHLDSSRRDSGTNDEPVFLVRPPFQDVLGIKLVSAHIPFSYYVINASNNSFTVLVAGTSHLVVLPVGNYTAATLAVALQTALTAADPAHLYTVTYSSVTCKLTFSTADADFRLVFDTTQASPLATLLGFAGYAAADSVGFSLPAPGVCVVTGDPYLVVVASVGNRIARNFRFNGATEPSPNILAVVPVTCDPWGIIEYTDPSSDYAFDMGEGTIQQIGLSLLLGGNIDSGALSLNGAPWKVYIQVLTRRETSVSNYASANQAPFQQVRSKRVRMK